MRPKITEMSGATMELELDALLEESRLRAGGLSDFGNGPFLDPLEKILYSPNNEPRLNAIGVMIAR